MLADVAAKQKIGFHRALTLDVDGACGSSRKPFGRCLRRSKLGMIGNVDTYSSQNVVTHTTGDTSSNGTPMTNGTAGTKTTTWAVKQEIRHRFANR